MLKIELTNSIKKDLKKYKHQKDVLLELQAIIELLAKKKTLPSKFRDHNLIEDWVSHRESHVRSDIY